MYHYRTAKYETRTLGGVRGALRQLLAEPSTRLACVIFLLLVRYLNDVQEFFLYE